MTCWVLFVLLLGIYLVYTVHMIESSGNGALRMISDSIQPTHPDRQTQAASATSSPTDLGCRVREALSCSLWTPKIGMTPLSLAAETWGGLGADGPGSGCRWCRCSRLEEARTPFPCYPP